MSQSKKTIVIEIENTVADLYHLEYAWALIKTKSVPGEDAPHYEEIEDRDLIREQHFRCKLDDLGLDFGDLYSAGGVYNWVEVVDGAVEAIKILSKHFNIKFTSTFEGGSQAEIRNWLSRVLDDSEYLDFEPYSLFGQEYSIRGQEFPEFPIRLGNAAGESTGGTWKETVEAILEREGIITDDDGSTSSVGECMTELPKVDQTVEVLTENGSKMIVTGKYFQNNIDSITHYSIQQERDLG